MNPEDFEAMKKELAANNIDVNKFPIADLITALALPTTTVVKAVKRQDPPHAALILRMYICSLLNACNDSLDESLNMLTACREMILSVDKDIDKFRPGPLEESSNG